MGGNHTGMIMAARKKQPRKRGGNKTRAPEETWVAEDAAPPFTRPNLQEIPRAHAPGFKGDTTETELRLAAHAPALVETFIGALGAAFATRAYRHLTEPRRLVVFVGHVGMHSGAPVLHVTDELERTEDGRVLARPSCSPEHVSPAMKAWPVTHVKETHDALRDGAHWCRRCEELAKVQVAEFTKRRAESFAAGGGIIGPTVKHEPPIGPERAQKLMDDLAAVREPQPRPTPQVSEAAKAAAAAWAPFLQAADHRVSQSCKNCSFVGAVDGEPACNLSRHYVPFDPDAEIAPYWCRLRQGPVLVTLEEKP